MARPSYPTSHVQPLTSRLPSLTLAERGITFRFVAQLWRSFPQSPIIGPGKVGTALGAPACGPGWPLRAVAGRTLAKARAGTKTIALAFRESRAWQASHPAPRSGLRLARLASLATSPGEAARAGELILLTVPDDAIGPLCRRLAGAGAFRKGGDRRTLFRALGSDVLAPAREAGSPVGSMHPLQTFPTVEAALGKLPGSYFFIEGDPSAARTPSRLAVAIGGIPVRIAPRPRRSTTPPPASPATISSR